MHGDTLRTFGQHTVAAGLSYELTRVFKYYADHAQPTTFTPYPNPSTPNARRPSSKCSEPRKYVPVVTFKQLAHEQPLGSGLRASLHDFFDQVDRLCRGFGIEPSVEARASANPRVYASSAAFEPFSLENVSPHAAYLLDLPLQPTLAQFDLKPERDTQLEFGGHIPVGSGDLGFRVWQKNANDLIDDTQVGLTLLHQNINYVLGDSRKRLLTTFNRWNGTVGLISLLRTSSRWTELETQLLAPCFGSPTDFTPADHEQNWSIASGVLLNNRYGGWFFRSTGNMAAAARRRSALRARPETAR